MNRKKNKKCAHCGSENVYNALVCFRCGERFGVIDTVSLSANAMRDVVDKIENTARNLASGTIALYVAGAFTPLIITVENDVVLGRHTDQPDASVLDLTPYNAGSLGVSRGHAIIHPFGKNYSIEDTGSTNGTTVNGQPLTPFEPRILKDDDTIRLGKLAIQIRLPSE